MPVFVSDIPTDRYLAGYGKKWNGPGDPAHDGTVYFRRPRHTTPLRLRDDSSVRKRPLFFNLILSEPKSGERKCPFPFPFIRRSFLLTSEFFQSNPTNPNPGNRNSKTENKYEH